MTSDPPAVRQLADVALAHGWRVRVHYALGPPSNVALLVRRGRVRAYGWWRTDKGVRWCGAATFGQRHYPTTAAFRALLESEAE